MRIKFLRILAICFFLFPQLFNVSAQETNQDFKHGKYVRIIALAQPFSKDNWMLTKQRGLTKDYTAQDVLEMIADLKPDCLERFITGCPNPKAQVPVRKGSAPMTVLQFLNAAIKAGGENCYIIPKLNLAWLKSEKGEAFFWKVAQDLYDLPLVRPIRDINLDVWDVFCKEICTTPEERAEFFQKLRSIGFQKIGVNMTGMYRINDPGIDYADFNIDKNTWQINQGALDKLNTYDNLKELFMYIDYPRPMNFFVENTPDRQAQIYCEEIFPYQDSLKYTYVYPILQDSWDATAVYTSEDGPYKGKSIYDITKELLNR